MFKKFRIKFFEFYQNYQLNVNKIKFKWLILHKFYQNYQLNVNKNKFKWLILHKLLFLKLIFFTDFAIPQIGHKSDQKYNISHIKISNWLEHKNDTFSLRGVCAIGFGAKLSWRRVFRRKKRIKCLTRFSTKNSMECAEWSEIAVERKELEQF